jgi:exonuclease V
MRSRLRTLPFLPPHKRPDVITSKSGKEIVVDKVKVEDKEKILKRGQVSTSFLS